MLGTHVAKRSILNRDFVCCRCSSSVTNRAHADGRAEELEDVALYLCDACATELKEVDISKVDDYTILQRLGKGGMSVVYLAWHEPTCRVVALKKVLPHIANLKGATEFFLHEVKIMKSLVHSNIIYLMDYKASEKGFYFVFEYLPGGNLNTYIRCSCVPEVCTIMCQILDALEYAHKKAICHRDIKPHNILLTADKRGKLSDFTLARSFEESEIRKDGIGRTIPFLAPEEIGTAYVDPSADVYSVGMSLYYILAGTFPFYIPRKESVVKAFLEEKKPADPLAAIVMHKNELNSRYDKALKDSILGEYRIPIQQYRKELPDELAQIIDKAVKHDKDRFTSAQEMKDALMKWLNENERGVD
jgi:serine/threonine protein kinase